MKLKSSIPINASPEAIWAVISDIENAVNNISGIEKVEIHNQPADTLTGLKWTETRTMFGKTATETMEITESVTNEYYKTRAENHGALYISTMRIKDENGKARLEMEFEGIPQTFMAKVMSAIMTPFFKGATMKVLKQDLEDIRRIVEQ